MANDSVCSSTRRKVVAAIVARKPRWSIPSDKIAPLRWWALDRRTTPRPAGKAKEGAMCLTCGCMLPHEDHGKADYLTIEDLEASATLDNYSLDEAVKNFSATVEVRRKSQITSIGETADRGASRFPMNAGRCARSASDGS
jgi:hypothetical protein